MDSGKENSSGSSGSKRRRDLNLMDKDDDEDDLTVRKENIIAGMAKLLNDGSRKGETAECNNDRLGRDASDFDDDFNHQRIEDRDKDMNIAGRVCGYIRTEQLDDMEKVNQFAQIGARTTATENDQVSNEEENVDTERDEEEDAFDQFILDAAENETIGKEVDDGDMDSGKENSSGSSGSKRRRDLNLMDKDDDEDDLTVRSTRRLS
ncbi:acidic leucine-rich nuclear phosphoprotein 32-related protein 1-like [Gossypium hirsutum]|uniref:Acidic leucine-rich nuclear phosphoprotein 32-related protein 1-like n=1 Tax=Gossypium hirsutum TaxID=3635 RepID=A0ABM2ZDD3_GOSHI|nr:acidic leucine-rich nuclear phosphoprotein 32-related protein 1-like [Gossypium hirsutum]